MQFGKIAAVNKPVSRLVLGTMIIDSREQERSNALLDAVVACGGNTLDTANVYAGGFSERGIGNWMDARGNRDDIVILTKGCHPNSDRKRVTPFDLATDLHDSFARLKTDYIDIYLLHRDDAELPVGPIVEALNEQHALGHIGAFGGSNWTYERLAKANEYADSHGLVPFTVSSPNFGLAEQVLDPWGPGCVSISGASQKDARAWYVENHMPAFAYSSLARGFFSGRISRENFPDTESTLDRACRTAYCHEVNFQRLDRAYALAEEKGVSIPQLVLAYMFSSPVDVFPIVGAANGQEFAQNVQAFDIALSPEECAWLELERDAR